MSKGSGEKASPARLGIDFKAVRQWTGFGMLGWDEESVVGVIGGLGPLATAYFLQSVVERTDVGSDQEHIDLLVTQHSSTPDRTARILDENADDPAPVMAHDAILLEHAGARALVLPCNTAHHFVQAIKDSVSVPLLDIVEQSVEEVGRRQPDGALCAILATDGTLKARVYQTALEVAGHRFLIPDDQLQSEVMDVIYGQVKAGNPVDFDQFMRIIDAMREQGATIVLLGCTELSVVAKDAGILEIPDVVDSLDTLAKATVRWAGRAVR